MTAAHWPVGAKAISACRFALPVDLRRLFVFRVSLSGTEISPASPLAVAGLNAGLRFLFFAVALAAPDLAFVSLTVTVPATRAVKISFLPRSLNTNGPLGA